MKSIGSAKTQKKQQPKVKDKKIKAISTPSEVDATNNSPTVKDLNKPNPTSKSIGNKLKSNSKTINSKPERKSKTKDSNEPLAEPKLNSKKSLNKKSIKETTKKKQPKDLKKSPKNLNKSKNDNEDENLIESESKVPSNKLQKALKKESDELLSIIGDREDVLTISSNDLAKLMGDNQSRRALIKKYGKNRLKLEMYIDKLIYLISKGGKIRRVGDVNKDSFQITTDRIYTYNRVIKIFAVEETPELLETNFEYDFKRGFIERFPTCEMMIKEATFPYYINFESKDIIYHLEYWGKKGSNLSKYEDDTKNDFVRSLTETSAKSARNNRDKRMLSSFYKIKEYQKAGFRFDKVYRFIYVYAPDEYKLDDCEDYIRKKHTDYKVTTLKGILPQFLKTFGSAYLEDDDVMLRSINTQVLADIDSAKLTPFEQGSNGANGICVGLDVETNLPVNLPLTADAKGKTVLIVGPTGEGKSAEAKGIAYFHKINKDRIVFMDYEGYEYNAFIKRYGGLKISQDLVNPMCVNTLKLGDCRYVSDDEAKRRINKAKASTSLIFKILYADSISEMDTSDINKIIDDVIKQAYMKFNVVEGDRQTYHNSERMTYFDLYDVLITISTTSKENKTYTDLLENSVNRLASYWSREGAKRYLFENEVSFEEIYKANTIQFSLGMAEQRENTVDAKDVRLKYFNLEYILTEYALYNRSKDIFTAVFLEELQRAEGDEILMRLYNHLITGGRKLNLNNYILTNSLKNLFTSNSKDAKAIVENINILLIGPITVEARKAIIEAYSLQQIESQINEVAENPAYDYSFLMTYKNRKVRHSSIVRMDLPNEIMKNDIFHTRTIKE